MSSAGPAEIDSHYTFWQKSLIPAESVLVRSAMRQAAKWGGSDNFFYSHFLSVACAVCAVVFSFFNGLSYILQIPFKLVLNILRFSPLQAVIDPFLDLRSGSLSFLFVSFGITFIVAGTLFPGPIFTFFAPEYFDSKEEKLEHLNNQLQKENTALSGLNEDRAKKIESAAQYLDKQNKELESLKRIPPKKGFFSRFFK